MQKPGLVIALDGPDGAGKTTQIELLQKYLEGKGKKVHAARASGGTPVGEYLRKVSLSHNQRPPASDVHISLAMFAALAEDLSSRKQKGEVIVVDRSPLAMVAYNAYGGELPDNSNGKLKPGKKQVLEAAADTCKAWGIDLLLFLDAPQGVLDNRRRKRGEKDYFENQDSDYHHRVRHGYRAGLEYLNSQKLQMRIAQIDASPDIAAMQLSINEAVDKLIA